MWENKNSCLWDFEFDNLCSEFSYCIEQSLNNFESQDHIIHDMCDVVINEMMQYNVRKQADFVRASKKKKIILLRIKIMISL